MLTKEEKKQYSEDWMLKNYNPVQMSIKIRCETDDSSQKHHTPYLLCNEIILQLAEHTDSSFWDDSNILVLYNVEFIYNLIYEFGVKPENITFWSDSCGRNKFVFKHFKVNILEDNLFELMRKNKVGENIMKKQFDVVIGNPPYQGQQKNYLPGKGCSAGNLWDKFMRFSMDGLVKKDGYVCLVHPGLWRKPEHKLLDLVKQKDLIYLEMHSDNDGNKTFKAATSYDWYVIKNQKYNGKTIIKDYDGNVFEIDLKNCSFIPNCNFDFIQKLLAKKDEEKCEVILSHSSYDPRKKWMSKIESDEFKYPCVYSLTQKNGLELRYSNTKDKGHFGVKKVIMHWMGSYIDAIVDDKGQYGMTQWAFGIEILNKEEGEKIKQSIKSSKFKKVWNAIEWYSGNQEWRVFKYFKKDFWKDFV